MQILLLILGALVLGLMGVAAHSMAYFPGDVAISHAVQAYHPDWLDSALNGVSWIGFPPEVDVLFGVIVLALALFGSRWAALMAAVAAAGSGGVYLLLQLLVGQPRPSTDLVRSAGALQLSGFPSGHLATLTAVFGFLAYLGYRRLRRSGKGWVAVVLVALFLALVSFARIYSGQHWASDVLAGLLLGAVWLGVVIRLYNWGLARQRRHSPAANRYVATRSSV